MTTADGRTGGAVPPGHMRPLLLVAIVVLAAALVLFLAPSSAAASSDVTWVAPEPDSDVKETISLEVRISANVTNVTFSYDGGSGLQLIGNGTFSAPDLCSINWATDWVPDGTYALVANASLSGGGHAEARVSDIRVDNTDPSIEIISPLPDQRVRGYYTIRVNCSKDIAYLEVFYYIGSGYVSLGLPQYDDVSGQWRLVWNTTFFDDQEALELIATGRDAAGNVQTTSAIDIHVDNVPPRPVLVQPEDNATLDGYVYLKADCSEPFLEDVHFEWRDAGYGWSMIGSAVWNATQELWVLHWNTYPVGEHEDVEIRVTAVDDLGQEDHDNATGVVITDIPPSPVFLTPEEGTHLTGTFEVRVWSQNDTRSMEFFYLKRGEWLPIGDAVGQEDGEWNLTWDTAGINLYETTIKAVAYDGSGSGNSSLEGIQVDNISPAPNFEMPGEYEYHLTGDVIINLTSDMDTTFMNVSYKNGTEWVEIFELAYDRDEDRWWDVWSIPEGLYVKDSALRVVAMDEVGLVGEDVLPYRTIGVPPGDIKPKFLPSMPEVVYVDEDQSYVLRLGTHINDDDLSTVKIYVTEEPRDLFFVDGENVTGQLDLTIITLPNRNGGHRVTVHIVDKNGQHAMTDLQVIVTSVPDPPVFTDVPPNLYVRPEVPYIFNYLPYVDDVDSPLEDLTVLKPDDARVTKVSTNPLALEFRFGKKDLDSSFAVNVTIQDPDGNIAWISIRVWVVNDWVPELREPLPDVWMVEDTTKVAAFNLDAFFFDKDQDALYYSYGNKYVRVVIGPEYPHPVSFYPPKDWYGLDSVTFRATDPTGALLEDTIIIRCNSTNDPPVFHKDPGLPDLVIRANETYHFDLSPYVTDADHELGDLNLLTNDPRATRSTKYTLGLQLNYPMMPDFILIITVVDPEGNSTSPAQLNVFISNNHPPILLEPPPDMVMVEAENRVQAFSVVSAWDEDWRDGGGSWKDLTFEFEGGPVSFEVGPNGWVSIQLPDPDFHTYNGSDNVPMIVLLRVMDSKRGLSEYTFSLTVLPVNDPPEVDAIGELDIEPSIVKIDLNLYIKDVDTSIVEMDIAVVDRMDQDKVVSNAEVYGSILLLDYQGSSTVKDELLLKVVDKDYVVTAELTVKVTAKGEEDKGFAWWTILLLVVVTGVVAVVASRHVWGRFEPPSVSDVFLVYGDGVIIRHMSKRGTMSMDEDLAIAMLTAIQEFVQQSMRSAQLKSMQAGDNNILIERDPSKLFYIAVIHTGSVTEELRRAINYATRSIKEEFGETLTKWDGNIAKFEGVDRYLDQILAISHAAIPEGVRFEMEGITSIEPGKTYLFQGKDVTRTHNIFRGLVEDSGSGLLISRVHPQRLHPSVPEAGAECIWLSKTPTKRGVSPSNTTMILHEITTHVSANERTVVCLDGLEYLLVHNPLDEVVAFVNELTDMAQVDDFTMMIHVDPYALDDSTLAKLSRNMVPVSDRTPPNGK